MSHKNGTSNRRIGTALALAAVFAVVALSATGAAAGAGGILGLISDIAPKFLRMVGAPGPIIEIVDLVLKNLPV